MSTYYTILAQRPLLHNGFEVKKRKRVAVSDMQLMHCSAVSPAQTIYCMEVAPVRASRQANERNFSQYHYEKDYVLRLSLSLIFDIGTLTTLCAYDIVNKLLQTISS